MKLSFQSENDFIIAFEILYCCWNLGVGHFPDNDFPDNDFPDNDFPDNDFPDNSLSRQLTFPTDDFPDK